MGTQFATYDILVGSSADAVGRFTCNAANEPWLHAGATPPPKRGTLSIVVESLKKLYEYRVPFLGVPYLGRHHFVTSGRGSSVSLPEWGGILAR